jgi:lysozyme family protein
MTFDDAIAFVLKAEGGYVNRSDDPGGETKYGISKRAYPHLDIAALTLEQAKEIYRDHYWAEICGDSLPDPWGVLLLDAAVNHGVPTAIKQVQRSIGATVDGVVGPETLVKLRAASGDAVSLYLADRLMYYTRLPTFASFGRGWCKRIVELARAI